MRRGRRCRRSTRPALFHELHGKRLAERLGNGFLQLIVHIGLACRAVGERVRRGECHDNRIAGRRGRNVRVHEEHAIGGLHGFQLVDGGLPCALQCGLIAQNLRRTSTWCGRRGRGLSLRCRLRGALEPQLRGGAAAQARRRGPLRAARAQAQQALAAAGPAGAPASGTGCTGCSGEPRRLRHARHPGWRGPAQRHRRRGSICASSASMRSASEASVRSESGRTMRVSAISNARRGFDDVLSSASNRPDTPAARARRSGPNQLQLLGQLGARRLAHSSSTSSPTSAITYRLRTCSAMSRTNCARSAPVST